MASMCCKSDEGSFSRDVPNFGITEISAETETEIRFRFHLGISISAEIRPKFGRNEIYQLFESCCYFSVDILHLSTKSIKLTKHLVKMFSVSTYIVYRLKPG
jgi:hypothetical protein